MAFVKFLNSKDLVECTVIPQGDNIVTLKFKGDIVVNTSGFQLYLYNNFNYDIGGDHYKDFRTIYRNDEETAKYNGYQLSNDGSIYVKPIPVVTFSVNGGGTLDGESRQEVENYEDLIIPEPVASEDYEFTGWQPTIPTTGEIDGNKNYTAIFTSTLPEPDPEPTIEERVSSLEQDVQLINDALGGNE